ncbi:MAG: xanthine dehydrogenase family protein molybdopterin-binding subunit [Deltaproteobacteria bacterium]|nr:xanthine dehydrogenase family protein molybdopterin-binding subunit [Deltaproteobacteria bacterium]
MSLGKSPEKVGALDRVLGRVRFGPDQGEPGDLYLAVVRVMTAPARLVGLDDAPALALPGVVRVFTARDIPGVNRLGIIPVTQDQEFLAGELVRFRGQAVAVVAAETRAAALAGARAVRVSYEELPGVFDPAEALAAGAPLVHPEHPTGNLLVERSLDKGDVDQAFARAAVTVEEDYFTSFVEHASLEVEGGRADWVDGRVVVTACTQNPHYDQADLAKFLGVDKGLIRVIQAETGGGFGGKLDLSVQPFLALACWHLHRPVRLAFTREESILSTAKRHPFRMHYKSAVDGAGRLLAVEADLLIDTGAFASYGLAVALRSLVHAAGPYHVPNARVRARLAYTHHPWAGAMRGFGVPQVALAHEGQMDALAAALGQDPLEFRYDNALRRGQSTITGQVLEGGAGLPACLDKIRPVYNAWQKRVGGAGRFRRGLGLGAMYYGIGNTGVANPSTAQVRWLPDNRVILYTGAADIGQGSDTVLRQLAAQRLGLEPGDIELCRGDTDRTTNAGATSASRQTYISGNAVLAAAADLERIILEEAGARLGVSPAELELAGGAVRARGEGRVLLACREAAAGLEARGKKAKGHGEFDPPVIALDHHTGQGHPYAAYAFAAQVALARVDTASGMVCVERVAAAHDVGKAIHRRGVLGQICGGVMMGVGLALMEEFEPGRTDNLQNYHLPTAADAPRIVPLIVEEPESTGPYGAKGVGEPALIPTAPAVAAAVSQAAGQRLRHLPLNLERVLEAIHAPEKGPEDSANGRVSCA